MSKEYDWIERNQRDPVKQAEYRRAMWVARWNLARGDARSLMFDLIAQIKKTGGHRQRYHGVRLLERAAKHLISWVD